MCLGIFNIQKKTFIITVIFRITVTVTVAPTVTWAEGKDKHKNYEKEECVTVCLAK